MNGKEAIQELQCIMSFYYQELEAAKLMELMTTQGLIQRKIDALRLAIDALKEKEAKTDA